MENYINSIFEKQSETEIKTLIQSYGREQGLNTERAEQLLKEEEEFCATDNWGGLRYSRAQIKRILEQI